MSFSEPFVDSRAIGRLSQGIGFKMCRRNGFLPASAYAEFSEFGFCAGANLSADLVFGTDALFTGTIREQYEYPTAFSQYFAFLRAPAGSQGTGCW